MVFEAPNPRTMHAVDGLMGAPLHCYAHAGGGGGGLSPSVGRYVMTEAPNPQRLNPAVTLARKNPFFCISGP